MLPRLWEKLTWHSYTITDVTKVVGKINLTINITDKNSLSSFFLHWNSMTASLCPIKWWMGWSKLLLFHRYRLFSLRLSVAMTTVTKPSPNGWWRTIQYTIYIYRISHKSPSNINYYEMSFGHVYNQSSGKIYCFSKMNFMKFHEHLK